MKITQIAGVATAIALTVAAVTACEVPEDQPGTKADRAATSAKHDAPVKPQDPTDPATTKPAGPKMTPGQEQALGSANDYLDNMAFSLTGLVDQLTFEGFSVKDATWAARHVKTDWNNQAALSAKEYLRTQHFSHAGLVDQLEFEGFTPEQAEHGATAAGL